VGVVRRGARRPLKGAAKTSAPYAANLENLARSHEKKRGRRGVKKRKKKFKRGEEERGKKTSCRSKSNAEPRSPIERTKWLKRGRMGEKKKNEGRRKTEKETKSRTGRAAVRNTVGNSKGVKKG